MILLQLNILIPIRFKLLFTIFAFREEKMLQKVSRIAIKTEKKKNVRRITNENLRCSKIEKGTSFKASK